MFGLATTLLLLAAALGPTQQDERATNLDVIIGQIGALESDNDPKCHATATRLENFIFGTPLTNQARARKVELQKELVAIIWRRASELATSSASETVLPEHMHEAIASVLDYRATDSGGVTVGDIELSERDVRQYGSIAYALRAILAVEQDNLLGLASPFLPTEPSAIDALKGLIDVQSLAALYIADNNARVFNESEISAARFAEAWNALSGPLESTAEVPQPAVATRTERFPVIERIIERKIASYDAYNDVSMTLFWQNIKSYFARLGAPSDEASASAFQRAFATTVVLFVADLLRRSETEAARSSEAVIRAPVIEASQHLEAPFVVNEYEDVVFFHRLSRNERIVIESYDMDAFRDSGLHWKFLGECIRHPSFPGTLELDPFAAELAAEAAAQYGVLLFRVAGELAKRDAATVLDASHIRGAAQRIRELAKRHHEADDVVEAPEGIASAGGPTRRSVAFQDRTAEVTIDFMHRSSDWLSRFQRSYLFQLSPDDKATPSAVDSPPSFSGAGVAAEDIDGDDDIDILLVGGLGNTLFLNDGSGGFRARPNAGLDFRRADGRPGEPRQPLIADLDNDGHQDIIITYARDDHRVFKNLGDGTFEDVSDRAGLGGEGLIGGPATVFDFDRDGLLDIYIGYFGNYTRGVRPYLVRDNINADANRLFRNIGNFRFEDVTDESGTGDTGWAQAAVHVDFDADGWQDLVVANDFGQNAYLRNLGNGTFEDVTFDLRTDVPAHSMNVGTADLNRDGFPDFYISNILTMAKDEKYVLPSADTPMKFNADSLKTMRIVEANHLFLSTAGLGRLRDYALSDLVERGASSTGWAWDADFFDYDNDGDDDLYVVNGHIEYPIYDAAYSGAPELKSNFRDKESNVLFVNENGALQNVSETSGADFQGNSRGAAYLDYDRDGDLDIIVSNFHSKATFLENQTAPGQGWLSIRLRGRPELGTNRDAIGASLLLTTSSGQSIWRVVQGSTGYLSAHPKEQHFGLGQDVPVTLTIRWPNGSEEIFSDLEPNQRYQIEQSSNR